MSGFGDFEKRTPKYALNAMMEDMLMQLYTHGEDPERDQKVAEAFERVANIEFDPIFAPDASDGEHQPGTILHGPPGHGKTSIAKIAAQKVAELCDMQFWHADEFPISKRYPTKNDFLFHVKELAGQVSAASVAGVTAQESVKPESNEEELRYATQLPDQAFKIAQHAGGNAFVFDDMGNAAQHVIPAMLNVFNDRRYGPNTLGKNAYVIGTTNLGKSSDGAVGVAQLGSAMATRVRNLYVQDQVDEWIDRFQHWKNVNVKDPELASRLGLMADFMHQHGQDIFYETPSRDGTPYVTPRSLDSFAQRQLPRLVKQLAKGNDDNPIRRIQRVASEFIGTRAGYKFGEYLYSYMLSAAPLAADIVSNEELDEDEREKRINEAAQKFGAGRTGDEHDFAQQFAASLVQQVHGRVLSKAHEQVERYGDVDGEELAPVIKAYTARAAKAASKFDQTHFFRVADQLANNLRYAVRQPAVFGNDPAPAYTDEELAYRNKAYNALEEGFAPILGNDKDMWQHWTDAMRGRANVDQERTMTGDHPDPS